MRQPITPLAEAGTRNDQLIVVVLSALKVKGFCDLVRQMTGWSLSGSNSSRLARPSIVASDWLLTCVVKRLIGHDFAGQIAVFQVFCLC